MPSKGLFEAFHVVGGQQGTHLGDDDVVRLGGFAFGLGVADQSWRSPFPNLRLLPGQRFVLRWLWTNELYERGS